MEGELTNSSSVIGQPKGIVKNLTKYQKAVLYKCLIEIEGKNKKFGFMGDKPGAGKSAMILALILADKGINKNSQSIIVVPQNILAQWESEIKTFCGENMSYVIVDSYALAREFYDEDNVTYYKTFDVILTTSTMYNLLKDIMSASEYHVKRVIFDEIDTVENLFDNMAIAELRNKQNKIYKDLNDKLNTSKELYDIIWYVSASINNLIDEDSFTLGSFTVDKKTFLEHYVKCSDAFIEQHSLNPYKANYIEKRCNSVADIYADYLSIEQLDTINSLSFNKIIGEYTSKCASNEKETIPIIVEDYYTHVRNLKEEIDKKEKQLEQNKKRKKKTDDLQKLLDKDLVEHKFYMTCLTNFYKVVNAVDYKEFVEKYNASDIKINKLVNLREYLRTTPSKKLILFSDYTDGFNHIIKFFDEGKIKYTDLGKGNLKEINEAIEAYKKNDTKFLLIDSASEGCGLNLENTDEIIFIHRTDETLKDQMVGRALRPGRNCDLKVVTFLNQNEIV